MKHNENLEENRKFQLERVSLFSDAVIAIAITLLIIELKLPEAHSMDADSFLNSLKSIWFNIAGFLCSFFLIGLYWTIHHKIFEFVKSFDNKLIWLNIQFLLFIVLLPFTTSIAFENFTNPDYPWIVYSLNHIMVNICILRMWIYLDKNPDKTVGISNKRFLKFKKWRSIGTIIVFVFSILLGLVIHPGIARFCPILISLSIVLINKKFNDVSNH